MFAVLTAAAWGIFGSPHAAAVAVLMWGVGDAFAALVGIPLGKHKVKWKLTDGKKSWEGSLAMLCVSFLTGFILIHFRYRFPAGVSLATAFAGALAGTLAELLSDSEWDTVTVPVVILAVFLLIVK